MNVILIEKVVNVFAVMSETRPQRPESKHAIVSKVCNKILAIAESANKKTARKIAARRTLLALFGEKQVMPIAI